MWDRECVRGNQIVYESPGDCYSVQVFQMGTDQKGIVVVGMEGRAVVKTKVTVMAMALMAAAEVQRLHLRASPPDSPHSHRAKTQQHRRCHQSQTRSRRCARKDPGEG